MLWQCLLDDKKGVGPAEAEYLGCQWCWFDWSFVSLRDCHYYHLHHLFLHKSAGWFYTLLPGLPYYYSLTWSYWLIVSQGPPVAAHILQTKWGKRQISSSLGPLSNFILLSTWWEEVWRQWSGECIFLLPPDRSLSNILTSKGHDFELPNCLDVCINDLSIINCLFTFY